MIICLVITIIFELLGGIILGYRRKDLLIIILVNILTNPLLNSVLNYVNLTCTRNVRTIVYIFGEIFVFILEGLIYKFALDKKKINPFVLSLILNIITLGIGLLLDYFIW